MADLVFTANALDQMGARHIPAVAVQHVVEYADDVLDRDDGCAEYRVFGRGAPSWWWRAATTTPTGCGP